MDGDFQDEDDYDERGEWEAMETWERAMLIPTSEEEDEDENDDAHNIVYGEDGTDNHDDGDDVDDNGSDRDDDDDNIDGWWCK